MQIRLTLSSILWALAIFINEPNLVHGDGDGEGEGSGSGSGDDPWNEYGGDDNFYSFTEYGDAAMHWSDYSIIPEACINRGGSDIIVYSLYSYGNNECARKSMGKFYVTVAQYVKAYAKKLEKAAELEGEDYDEPAALDYLECTGYGDDDQAMGYYTKLGCKNGAWKALAINAYKDQYCSEPIDEYNFQVDLTDVKLNYQICQSCSNWDIPQNDEYDDQLSEESEYFSPLCSAVWNYREVCDGSCQRQMKLTTGAIKERSYSATNKFMLFFLSSVGIISMAAVLVVRRKMSRTDALLEQAAVEKVGLKKDHLPKIFLGTILFLTLLMLLKVKGLTFLLLIVIDVTLIAYWARLEFHQKGRINVGGFHIYGNEDGERSMS